MGVNFKFRIWCKSGPMQGMTHSDRYYISDDGKSLDDIFEYIQNLGVIMQFTGILDKNGKEIYEGDIIQSVTGKIDKVVFANGCFMWGGELLCYEDDDGLQLMLPEKWATVIGNIYESPETNFKH